MCEQAVAVIDGNVVATVTGESGDPWTTNVPKSGIAYVLAFSENNNAMTSVTSSSILVTCRMVCIPLTCDNGPEWAN
jgi:hypothetical protein